MALPDFTMRELLEAGVHFGHQTHRWNPRMKPYIYGERSGIHIMDLSQTVPALHQALVFVRDSVAKGGRVLFVGTKRQASDPVAEAAKRDSGSACAQQHRKSRTVLIVITIKGVQVAVVRLRDFWQFVRAWRRWSMPISLPLR